MISTRKVIPCTCGQGYDPECTGNIHNPTDRESILRHISCVDKRFNDAKYMELLHILLSMEERIRSLEDELEYERTVQLEAGEYE